jgi:hypothetical protein
MVESKPDTKLGKKRTRDAEDEQMIDDNDQEL